MHATIELARRIELAEIEFCALAASAATPGQGADRQVDILDAGGGRALFSRPGSPLNKMLGLGLRGRVADDDLQRIEAFYASRQSPAQIELCPMAYGDVATRLGARGFLVEAFENVLAMRIGDGAGERGSSAASDAMRSTSALRVGRTTTEQDDVWTRVVAEGFAAAEPLTGGGPDLPPITVEQMIAMMSQFVHPEIRRYLVWADDEPAGGGAAWLSDGILGIFGTSTRARFRRRGIQTLLTIASIDDARGQAETAVAVTAPGSTSQRTFERLGFRVLYTRTILVKA